MKRYGNIYNKICDIENLKLAHKNARKDKLFYKEVKMVDENEDYYLQKIQEMLINKTYEVSKYTYSKINDKGKERDLCKLPYFPDRIIQWAIILQIEDIFMKTFCYHICASLKGRGIKRASELTEKYIKDENNSYYCLKFDIKKFYPSINHTILKELLKKKFKDKDLLNILFKIIDSTDGDTGIPIGSYLSQYFGNFYLSYFDHWLKEDIGCKYVVRYMDDIIIFDNSPSSLHFIKVLISNYLKDNLKLNIKHNWQVFPTNIRGVDFVGFRHFFGYKLLRKSTCKNFKKRMNLIKKKSVLKLQITYSDWCSANSYNGWLKWCDSYRLRNKYYEPIKNILEIYYQNNIKKQGVIL